MWFLGSGSVANGFGTQFRAGSRSPWPQINFLKPFQTLFKHLFAKLGFHVGKFVGKIEFLVAPLAKVPDGK